MNANGASVRSDNLRSTGALAVGIIVLLLASVTHPVLAAGSLFDADRPDYEMPPDPARELVKERLKKINMERRKCELAERAGRPCSDEVLAHQRDLQYGIWGEAAYGGVSDAKSLAEFVRLLKTVVWTGFYEPIHLEGKKEKFEDLGSEREPGESPYGGDGLTSRGWERAAARAREYESDPDRYYLESRRRVVRTGCYLPPCGEKFLESTISGPTLPVYVPAPAYRGSAPAYRPVSRPPVVAAPHRAPAPFDGPSGRRPPSSTITGPTPLDRPSTVSPSPPRVPAPTVTPSPPPRTPPSTVTTPPPRTPPSTVTAPPRTTTPMVTAPTSPAIGGPGVTTPTSPTVHDPVASAPTPPAVYEPSVTTPTSPSVPESTTTATPPGAAPAPTAGLPPGRTPGSDVSAGPGPGGVRLDPKPTRTETTDDLVKLRRDILRGRNAEY